MNKFLLPLVAVVLAGCANIPTGKSVPVHYWRLQTPAKSLTVSDVAPQSAATVMVKVIPADPIKGKRLAVAKSANEISYVESQRWVEPIETGVARIIRETLADRYEKVESAPLAVVFKPDWRVEVSLDEVWPSTKGEVLLAARWWITSADSKVVKTGSATLTQSNWTDGDWRGYAVRLGDLSQKLALAIDKDLSSLDAERKNP